MSGSLIRCSKCGELVSSEEALAAHVQEVHSDVAEDEAIRAEKINVREGGQ